MSPAEVAQSTPMPPEAISELQQGRVIEAIKIVRKARGLRLKEAKDAVDAYVRNRPALQRVLAAKREDAKGALLRLLLVLGAIGLIIYFLLGSK